jgi:hypothetical protein
MTEDQRYGEHGEKGSPYKMKEAKRDGKDGLKSPSTKNNLKSPIACKLK